MGPLQRVKLATVAIAEYSAVAGRGTLRVATGRSAVRIYRTAAKGILVGGATAAGAALFGPVGAAIAAGIAGTAVAGSGGHPPAGA